jgi:hypothetical protein
LIAGRNVPSPFPGNMLTTPGGVTAVEVRVKEMLDVSVVALQPLT